MYVLKKLGGRLQTAPMTGCDEHGSEPTCCIKGKEFDK
jgi:hypothetical protein